MNKIKSNLIHKIMQRLKSKQSDLSCYFNCKVRNIEWSESSDRSKWHIKKAKFITYGETGSVKLILLCNLSLHFLSDRGGWLSSALLIGFPRDNENIKRS